MGDIYRWGRGNAIQVADSTVVTIDTDAGLSGVDEFCPCGENYMDLHREGTEVAARLIAPAILRQDSRQIA